MSMREKETKTKKWRIEGENTKQAQEKRKKMRKKECYFNLCEFAAHKFRTRAALAVCVRFASYDLSTNDETASCSDLIEQGWDLKEDKNGHG